MRISYRGAGPTTVAAAEAVAVVIVNAASDSSGDNDSDKASDSGTDRITAATVENLAGHFWAQKCAYGLLCVPAPHVAGGTLAT